MNTDPLSLGVSLGQSLEKAGIDYALGGALALGVHGLVRATWDVDLNVFVPATSARQVLEVLSREGLAVDLERALHEAASEGVAVAWHGQTRVDLFFRPTNLVNLETLVGVNPGLDASRVRALMVETMGPDDVRVSTWDALVLRARAGCG